MEHDEQTRGEAAAREESASTPLVHTFGHMWQRRAEKACVCTTCVATIIAYIALILHLSRGGGWGNSCLPAGRNSSVRDFEWVSVQHLAPKCFNEKAEEGFGRGWVDADPNPNPRPRPDPVGYGCWFVVVEDATHSVRVNTRRVLAVETRAQAAAALNVTCLEETNCQGYADDLLWCQRAMALGYDSIQTVSAHGIMQRNEIVLCYEGCMQERLYESGCVPVETRNAQHEVCSCNSATKALSCGDDQVLGCGDGCD